jgi:hypothetical protein
MTSSNKKDGVSAENQPATSVVPNGRDDSSEMAAALQAICEPHSSEAN